MYGGKIFYWTSTGARMTAAKNSHQRSLQILNTNSIDEYKYVYGLMTNINHHHKLTSNRITISAEQ